MKLLHLLFILPFTQSISTSTSTSTSTSSSIISSSWYSHNSTLSNKSKLLNIQPRSSVLNVGNKVKNIDDKDNSNGNDALFIASLYYGNYISLKENYILGKNDDILSNYGLLIEKWNYNYYSAPQKYEFINWIINKLDKNYPIISGFYENIQTKNDYDIIMNIIGYDKMEEDIGIYYIENESDQVIKHNKPFNDRLSCSKGDTKYCLPDHVDIATAIIGNKYSGLPVNLILNKVEGHTASSNGVLKVNSLVTGNKYTCARFDSPPTSSNFLRSAGPIYWKHQFIATSTSESIPVVGLLSTKSYYYRCIPSEYSGVEYNLSKNTPFLQIIFSDDSLYIGLSSLLAAILSLSLICGAYTSYNNYISQKMLNDVIIEFSDLDRLDTIEEGVEFAEEY